MLTNPIKRRKAILSALGISALTAFSNHAAAITPATLDVLDSGKIVTLAGTAPQRAWSDYGTKFNYGWTHRAGFKIFQVGTSADIAANTLFDVEIDLQQNGSSKPMNYPAFSIWTSGTAALIAGKANGGNYGHAWSQVRGAHDGGTAEDPCVLGGDCGLGSNGWLGTGGGGNLIDGHDGWIGYANAGYAFTNGDGDKIQGLLAGSSNTSNLGQYGGGSSDPLNGTALTNVNQHSPYVKSGTATLSAGDAKLTLAGLKAGYYLIAYAGSCPDANLNNQNCAAGESQAFKLTLTNKGITVPTCTLPEVLINGACATPPPTCTLPEVLQGNVCALPSSTNTYTSTYIGTGETLTNITLTSSAAVTKVNLAGVINNQGILNDVTANAGVIVMGGKVSTAFIGDATNPALLIGTSISPNTRISNVSLSGGSSATLITLGGKIINQYTLKDVTLLAGTTLSGGVLSGTVTGDSTTPPILNGVNMESGTILKDISLSANSTTNNVKLTGKILNQGMISNASLAADTSITGGILSGTISGDTSKPGTLNNVQLESGTILENIGSVTFASNSVINNVALTGSINNKGTLKNAILAAGTKLSGGTLAGSITGDATQPAELSGFFLAPDTTLTNVSFPAGTSLTNTTLGGIIVNQGTLDNVTLAAGTVITGGTLSGTITGDSSNPAILKEVKLAEGAKLINVNFPSAAQSNVTLSGNVTNQGTLNNVTLLADATLSGGTLTGTITGDATKPAKLSNVILNDAKLSNVVLSDLVTATNVTLGANVINQGALKGVLINTNLLNQGSLTDVTLAAGVSITGGSLSGTVTGVASNPSVLNGITITDATLKNITLAATSSATNVTISGSILNQSTLTDVTLAAGASIKGGTLAGTIEGDADKPGLLDAVTLAADASLSNVNLSSSTLGSNITLGAGINSLATLKNITLIADGSLTGGSVSGTIIGSATNPANLNGVAIADGTRLSNVILSGINTITDTILSGFIQNQGTLKNANFTAGATLSGGSLAGNIKGDANNPALLSNINLEPGTTLTNVNLTDGSAASGVQLTSNINNLGNLENLTLAPGVIVTGGNLSGNIIGDSVKPAQLNGVKIASGSSLSNVKLFANDLINDISLSGSISSQGELHNVSLTANTTLNGGSISGEITGDSAKPALLQNLTIEPESALRHVILGANVTLDNSVKLGLGVKFSDENNIPDQLELTQAFSKVNTPKDINPVDIPDLQQDVLVNANKSLLTQLRTLPDLQPFIANLTQTFTGKLEVKIGKDVYILLPTKIYKTTSNATGISFTQDGQVQFITPEKRLLLGNLTIKDGKSLTETLAPLNLNLQEQNTSNGNLTISTNTKKLTSSFSILPALKTEIATLGNIPGVISAPYLPNMTPQLTVNYLLYLDNNGELWQQALLPTPAYWEQLRQALEALHFTQVTLQVDGLIKATDPNGVVHQAIADYTLSYNHPLSTQITFSQIEDINKDGQADVQINYPNGSSQALILISGQK